MECVLFNSKLRKRAVEGFNEAVERYVASTGKFETAVGALYSLRVGAAQQVRAISDHINMLTNVPREFKVSLERTTAEIRSFEGKQSEIKRAAAQAKRNAKGSAAGASLGALGVAVATMGPTVAMGVATTFGVASTGTAIASLSGAAATSAALAWLGGGTLVAGGGGMAAGTALLALAGPVGWTIAAGAALVSIGVGAAAAVENKKAADDVNKERLDVEAAIRRFDQTTAEVDALLDLTVTQMEQVAGLSSQVPTADYQSFSDDEKRLAAALVNTNLALARLINKEIAVDAEA
ncbi:hypothetical protein [Microbacterium dextranolyticum]|uniref:Uncharacterized protein n=1 Tax=Microbacterium dextranolyticum TaxID=36806 RepID=A0A9W6M5F5_9MICO|nr:hypothetical protein [Microbacterium dextranolyticum]MBM7462193.1 prefoldin subunit 5 [Microbacterium dextranolyticum]GLJ94443.1 hypothetical protein GCM10017591_05040 [Microbacterium dextranolyticum]